MEKLEDLTLSEITNTNGGGTIDIVKDYFIGVILEYIIGKPEDLKKGYEDGLKR